MSDKKITKYDLIDSVYQNNDVEKNVIVKVVDSFIESLKNSMAEGSTIELRGFGTFEPRLRKGRERARNPKTGEIVKMDPHYVAIFRSGKDLKKALYELEVKNNE